MMGQKSLGDDDLKSMLPYIDILFIQREMISNPLENIYNMSLVDMKNM